MRDVWKNDLTHQTSRITILMTPERWQQIKEIFQSAVDRRPTQRSAFLNETCAHDPALRAEVEALDAAGNVYGAEVGPRALKPGAKL